MRVRLKVERLQQLIAAGRLSQNNWAIKVGVSRGHWSSLVNGKHLYPSAKTRQRMLEAFGVEWDQLFEVERGSKSRDGSELRSSEEIIHGLTTNGPRPSISLSMAPLPEPSRIGARLTLGGFSVQLLQDLRLTMRSLKRSWRFAFAFVLPLALGLGAGATFFGVVDQVLYRPPPGVNDIGTILQFGKTFSGGRDPFGQGNVGNAWIDYELLRTTSTHLENVAATARWSPSLGRGESARIIPGQFATASFFPLLGVQPQLGRFYNADEDETDASTVPCVASDRLWRTELGADPSALGRQFKVGGLECTIVGVLPRGFNGLGYVPIDIWAPLRAGAWSEQGTYAALWNSDASHWLTIFARLKPGASLTQANEDARRAYHQLQDRRRDREMKEAFIAMPMPNVRTALNSSRVRVAKWLAFGALALVLLVSANVVNLLVARNLSRARETAVRLALGGGWRRLFGYSLMECAALSVLAGAVSLVVVRWVGPIARTTLFPGVSWADGPVTARVAAAAMAASLLLGGIVAAITAYSAARVDPASLLSAGGSARTTGSRAGSTVRFGLVGFQAALSVLLLIASAGFVRSFQSAAKADLGFDIDRLIQIQVDSRLIDTSVVRQRALNERLKERLEAVPGVASASLGYMSPWWNNRNEQLHIPGRDSLPPVPNFGAPAMDAVTPEYLTTMGMQLTSGRFFNDADVLGSAPVLVVNQALARLYWPGQENVVGRCIIVGAADGPCREIVGVVKDHAFSGAIDAPRIPAYFVPWTQSAEFRIVGSLFVRAGTSPQQLLPTLRQIVQGSEPNLPAVSVRMVQTQLDPLLASWRLGALAFTALGAVAAVIAFVGLFSVLAYLVAERKREFAIRGALGASWVQIVQPVLQQSGVVVAAGSAVGLLVAVGVARWLQPLLFHVRLLEPVVIGAIAVTFMVVALAASLAPAHSASSVDLMEVLRD